MFCTILFGMVVFNVVLLKGYTVGFEEVNSLG